jgi:N-acetylglucosamine kinase-like BadF-type ATPase
VPYYLGIDGGGSKTTCAVADDSSLLATATAGPSNITRVGEAGAREALHQAIREACAAAKIAPRQVHRACIGVAGVGRKVIAETIRKIAAELIPGQIEVTGDMQIAMAAAFGAGPGVIVIAGTGSSAYGRNAQAQTARAGGWGFAISDEGSAHWIGRTAVSAVLRAIDEEKDAQTAGETWPLFHEMKSAWKLQSLDEFARTANSNPDFAALFPAVLSAADAGDTVSEGVLTQAGRELAQIAGIVARKLFPQDGAMEIPVAMAGGVFRHSRLVREVFTNDLRALNSRARVNPRVVDPVEGALLMARESPANK